MPWANPLSMMSVCHGSNDGVVRQGWTIQTSRSSGHGVRLTEGYIGIAWISKQLGCVGGCRDLVSWVRS